MWKPIILDVECIVCSKSLQKINLDPRLARRNMGKIANRRSRAPNWSSDEKQYLLELISERKEVVVTKTTNGPNHYEEKDVAWTQILRALTERFGNKFCSISIKKVKTQWQNMKRIAREEIGLNGSEMQKYTRQSLDVFTILDMLKDGVLIMESQNINVTDTSITTNIVVKAERIDDEINQPGGSGLNKFMEVDQPQNNSDCNNDSGLPGNQLESSGSSLSESNDCELSEELAEKIVNKKSVSANLNLSSIEETRNLNPTCREFEEFLRYKSAKKQLEVDSMKEERHIMRAMRETAELNKIIAEQRLKHVLWVNKQETAMA